MTPRFTFPTQTKVRLSSACAGCQYRRHPTFDRTVKVCSRDEGQWRL